MEMSVVLKNLKTGTVAHVSIKDFDVWDGLEERLGEDIDDNFMVVHVDADIEEVEKALYGVRSLEELEELSDRLTKVDEEKLEAFLEIWDFETSLSLLESGDYQLFRAKDEEELGREVCDDGYYVSVPHKLENYIDYEALGRDYSIDVNGGFTFIGFVEAL